MSDAPVPTPPDDDIVLAFDRVSVIRGGNFLVRGLTWQVELDERWVILGPNGAGKTTLLNLASGRLHPSRGTAWILGERLGRTDVNELRTRAINWSDSLASRSREAVQIGALHDGRVLLVHHVFRPDDSVQASQVGAMLPAHATALGKVLLANDPGRDPESEDWAPVTPRTITGADELDRELERVLDNGWAQEIEELVAGEAAIAAPIRDDRNLTVGAIAIRGAVERLCADRDTVRPELISFVRDAARAVSRDLGAPRW